MGLYINRRVNEGVIFDLPHLPPITLTRRREGFVLDTGTGPFMLKPDPHDQSLDIHPLIDIQTKGSLKSCTSVQLHINAPESITISRAEHHRTLDDRIVEHWRQNYG